MAVKQIGNTWYYRFKIKGREYYKAIPEATDKEDAIIAETRVKNDIFQGKYETEKYTKDFTFNELKDKFLDYAAINRIAWERSDKHIINHLTEFFKNKSLKEISPFFIEKYRQQRKDLGKANSTINKEIGVLRKMFNLAIENGWIKTNPCLSKLIKPLREDNKKERYLFPEEEYNLFNACYGEATFLRSVFIVALQTGMRKEEILSLKWDNVDFKLGYITLLRTKNGKKRNIPISSGLHKELKSLEEKRLSEYVFTNPETRTRYVDIRKAFDRVCKRANITDLRFHDLRHTAATRMVSAGIDLVVVQKLLGHADIKTTMRYAHPVPEREKQAVEALSKFSQSVGSKFKFKVV